MIMTNLNDFSHKRLYVYVTFFELDPEARYTPPVPLYGRFDGIGHFLLCFR